jgi:hypothetical protein
VTTHAQGMHAMSLTSSASHTISLGIVSFILQLAWPLHLASCRPVMTEQQHRCDDQIQNTEKEPIGRSCLIGGLLPSLIVRRLLAIQCHGCFLCRSSSAVRLKPSSTQSPPCSAVESPCTARSKPNATRLRPTRSESAPPPPPTPCRH